MFMMESCKFYLANHAQDCGDILNNFSVSRSHCTSLCSLLKYFKLTLTMKTPLHFWGAINFIESWWLPAVAACKNDTPVRINALFYEMRYYHHGNYWIRIFDKFLCKSHQILHVLIWWYLWSIRVWGCGHVSNEKLWELERLAFFSSSQSWLVILRSCKFLLTNHLMNSYWPLFPRFL